MGRVRIKTVKRAGRQIIEKYHNKLSCDFVMNKKMTSEVTAISSKRLRNKIAGFITHTMKRIKKSSVRGISLAVQQAESERHIDTIIEVSATEPQGPIEVDQVTAELLKSLKVGFDYTIENQYDYNRDRKKNDRREHTILGMN